MDANPYTPEGDLPQEAIPNESPVASGLPPVQVVRPSIQPAYFEARASNGVTVGSVKCEFDRSIRHLVIIHDGYAVQQGVATADLLIAFSGAAGVYGRLRVGEVFTLDDLYLPSTVLVVSVTPTALETTINFRAWGW